MRLLILVFLFFTAVSAHAQMAGWIDAAAAPYNVVCDNVTDNTAGINAALIAAHGKRLSLPPGRCPVDPLTIGVPYSNNPAHIQGYGTMLVGRAPSSSATITFDRTLVNMVVEGITVNAGYQHDWAIAVSKMTQDSWRDVIAQNGALGGIKIVGTLTTPVHHNTFVNVLSQQNHGLGWSVSGDSVYQNMCLNCKSMYNTADDSGFVCLLMGSGC